MPSARSQQSFTSLSFRSGLIYNYRQMGTSQMVVFHADQERTNRICVLPLLFPTHILNPFNIWLKQKFLNTEGVLSPCTPSQPVVRYVTPYAALAWAPLNSQGWPVRPAPSSPRTHSYWNIKRKNTIFNFIYCPFFSWPVKPSSLLVYCVRWRIMETY